MGRHRVHDPRRPPRRAPPQGRQARDGGGDPLPAALRLRLPHDFPPRQTVYCHLRRWVREGVWARIHHALLLEDRERSGRKPIPQSCRARQPDRPHGGPKRGSKDYDAEKRIHGRKRHILTDADGSLLAVEVHAADVQDRDGARDVLKRSRRAFPFVEQVFADGGYAGRLVGWAQDKAHVALASSGVPGA